MPWYNPSRTSVAVDCRNNETIQPGQCVKGNKTPDPRLIRNGELIEVPEGSTVSVRHGHKPLILASNPVSIPSTEEDNSDFDMFNEDPSLPMTGPSPETSNRSNRRKR